MKGEEALQECGGGHVNPLARAWPGIRRGADGGRLGDLHGTIHPAAGGEGHQHVRRGAIHACAVLPCLAPTSKLAIPKAAHRCGAQVLAPSPACHICRTGLHHGCEPRLLGRAVNQTSRDTRKQLTRTQLPVSSQTCAAGPAGPLIRAPLTVPHRT